MKKRKVVVAITGASGAIYAKVLLDKLASLQQQELEVGLTRSSGAFGADGKDGRCKPGD